MTDNEVKSLIFQILFYLSISGIIGIKLYNRVKGYIIEKRFKKLNKPPAITTNQEAALRDILESFKFFTFKLIDTIHKTNDSMVVVKRPVKNLGKKLL